MRYDMKKIIKKYIETTATNNKDESKFVVQRKFKVKGDQGVYSEHIEVPYVNDPRTNIITITATMNAADHIIAIINKA